jgi:hypothetical protein
MRVVQAISQVLYTRRGFHGNLDDYYNPDNSCINRVLEERTGIPITLSLVYMEVRGRQPQHCSMTTWGVAHAHADACSRFTHDHVVHSTCMMRRHEQPSVCSGKSSGAATGALCLAQLCLTAGLWWRRLPGVLAFPWLASTCPLTS